MLQYVSYKELYIDGSLSKRISYTGKGYDVTISLLFDVITVTFIGIRAVYQPNIRFYPGKGCFLEFNGVCDIPDVDEFIKNVTDAKELAEYVSTELENLLKKPN